MCAHALPESAPPVLLPPSLKRLHAQVYRQCQRGYWRASKRWCKALPPEGVNKALLRFANNEAGLRPVDIYGGARGAIAQLRELEAWFQARSRPRGALSCAPVSQGLLVSCWGDAGSVLCLVGAQFPDFCTERGLARV